MMEFEPVTMIAYSVMLLLTIGLAWVVTVLFAKNEGDEDAKKKSTEGDGKGQQPGGGKKNKGNKQNVEKPVGTKGKNKPRSRTTSEADSENHPWTVATFKGHAGLITDMSWSSNDKFIASCAQDRTVLIWFAKDLLTKDRRSIRVNVPFDNARNIAWSPDCTAFIVALEDQKVLEVYKLGKKAEGSHVTVNSLTKFKKVHDEDIIGIGIACTGLFIMSCSNDGNMILWDVKGSVLERMSIPVGVTATCAKVSHCGRYVAVCGNDCILVEVIFNEMKQFKSIRTFGKLQGHESRVEHVDFNADSSRIVTVTENGVWRLYDTTGNRINVVCMGQAKSVPIAGNDFFPTVSLSPDGRIVAVGHTNEIDIFEVTLGSPTTNIKPKFTLANIGVRKIVFSSDGKYILGAGEKSIQVFHNICGHLATFNDLARQMNESSAHSSLKSRLSTEMANILQDLTKLNVGESIETTLQEMREIINHC